MKHTLRAEIITIGDELLYGQIQNTNTTWMSQALTSIGIKVNRQISVGDEAGQIKAVLRSAYEGDAQILLLTGGLGPTKDDITKKTLADFFGTTLAPHPEALAAVEAYFHQRQRIPSEVQKQMGWMPTNAKFLVNSTGVAAGMWFEEQGKILVSMPGVPSEMRAIMQEEVIPRLKQHFILPVIQHKVIRCVGQGESFLASKIAEWEDNLPENMGLAYLPQVGTVDLRLTATGQEALQLRQEMELQVGQLLPLIGRYIYGYQDETLEEAIGQLLLSNQATIATAESCTGGYLAHLFTKVPGSSRYYQGGIVAYANEVKMAQLGVSADILQTHGAVSEACIRAMAEGVRQRLGTDIGVASSGVAGPDGGSAEKPVGTVWVAYSDTQGTYSKKLLLTPDRALNIQLASILILDLIRKKLSNIL
ncbi:competence/damage-inducible protein A [Eisenibacter elegans]|jgi:nicotinamide-nucleotide amidase|uniref:competence/damage-inducible protein A n=1 Tax=Eisenibacter elegans TaxID=997 RepID=UPI00040A0653|nr:competence/damage-inducible protein A [Eisenibacter elegans]